MIEPMIQLNPIRQEILSLSVRWQYRMSEIQGL
jgi:hypothetical protein